MRGAVQLLGDRRRVAVARDRVVVVVDERAGHPGQLRRDREQAPHIGAEGLDLLRAATAPRVQRQRLVCLRDRHLGRRHRAAQRPRLREQVVEGRGGLRLHQRAAQPVERVGGVAGQDRDLLAGRAERERRHDRDVHDQTGDGADRRLENAIDRVTRRRRAQSEHEHRADRHLVRRAGSRAKRPRDEQRARHRERHRPETRTQQQSDRRGDDHTRDHPDRPLDTAAERLADARLHRQQRRDRREHRRRSLDEPARDQPRRRRRDRRLHHLQQRRAASGAQRPVHALTLRGRIPAQRARTGGHPTAQTP